MWSSDSVFTPDSEYDDQESYDALEPFIWPKTGLGQPTQFWKKIFKTRWICLVKHLFCQTNPISNSEDGSMNWYTGNLLLKVEWFPIS